MSILYPFLGTILEVKWKQANKWMNEYVPLDLNRPAQELADDRQPPGIPVEEVLVIQVENLYW